MPFVLNTLNVPFRLKAVVFLQVAIKNTTAVNLMVVVFSILNYYPKATNSLP